jgi:hypothetical protein
MEVLLMNTCHFCQSSTEPLRRFWLYPENWESDRTVRIALVCEHCDHAYDLCRANGRARQHTVVLDCWFCGAPDHDYGHDENCWSCDVWSDPEEAVAAALWMLSRRLFGRQCWACDEVYPVDTTHQCEAVLTSVAEPF